MRSVAMKIFDISQEVFSCAVYPGDPSPKRQMLSKINEGGVCNLTALSMCAHNGTHIDAPYHFFDRESTVDQIPLESTVGYAFVCSFSGEISQKDAENILKEAQSISKEAAKRILIKGDAVLSLGAAEILAKAGILLFGNESQTVGPEEAPMLVHKVLLSHNVILLEGVRLSSVGDGVYFLSAAPLNLGGADGAPVRALLIQE